MTTLTNDIPRVDGLAKLRGTARYVDDLRIEGLLHGATVRSPAPRGRITHIHFDPSINWNEFTIVTAKDVPCNELQLIEHEQPVLAGEEFRHKYEPILLLAHEDPELLKKAVRSIRIDYTPLPFLLDPRITPTTDLIQYKTDNVFKHLHIRKGDPGPIFAAAPHVVEATYETGLQEHVYLETQGMLAYHDPESGRLVVKGSLQCPFYVLKSLTHAFNQPDDYFAVIQTPTGGAFGGKEDFPSHIGVHAALLAHKSGKPVKIIYDRHEDMAATTKRHPSIVHHRTALDNTGKLLAMEIDILMDGGAYATLSAVVLSRGGIHAPGPYHCDHVHVNGRAVLTNSVPNGAFRGFGAPQTLFAIERHIDACAAQLGISPVDIRKRNFIHDGQTTATHQVIKDKVDMSSLLDHTLTYSDYDSRKKEHESFNKQHPYLRKGIGFATFMHGSGFTGSGETMLSSKAQVAGLPDGRVEVLIANTEMGQGTETTVRLIAAHRLGMQPEDIVFAHPDTSRVPNSGPTVASRTVMVVGKLIERAIDDLLTQIGAPRRSEAAGSLPSPKSALINWFKNNPNKPLLGNATYKKPDTIHWDDATYTGDAYAAYSWAVYLADVTVDLRTCNIKLEDFVAMQEVGKVIHPTLAAGQIQGGVVQGIGYALTEECIQHEGAMRNNQLTNYIIPTSGDLPPIRVLFEESPSDFGPQGAKGIGELPIDGPAPALLNAICHALGNQSLNIIPLTPERLLHTLSNTSDHEAPVSAAKLNPWEPTKS
ncbi:MAG TPA: xanthine dehydrogenase family protein molybdopterin-binding subunit [Tepidisphaeraceae bacterium]|nr:xanthine dehydrogenase family protein molybdopterin-binding subunit [Tepidisphaeraceae bacterium]